MTLDLENINQQAAELGVHYLKIAPPAVMDLSRAMRDELEADHKLLVGAFTLSTRGEIVLRQRVAQLELENEELKARLA